MISANDDRTMIGTVGNFISLFLFMSPLPTFVGIWKKGSVQKFSPIPYLATLVNCMVWTFYVLPMVQPDSTLVCTINGSGISIEVVYIIVFLIYSDNKKRLIVLLVVLVEIICIFVLSFLVLTFAHTHSKRSMVVALWASYIATAFNIMMDASSLTVMIPNGLGAVFGLALLILYKSTQRLIAERKGKELSFSKVFIDDDEPKKSSCATDQNGRDPGNHHAT